MNTVIAHAGDLGTPSGGTSRVSALAAGLQSRGHEVTLVVPTPDGDIPDRLSAVTVEPVDVSTGSVASQFVRGLQIARRAKQVGERQNATLQFEHSPLAGIGSLLGCSDYVLDMHDLAYASPLYGDKPFGTVLQRLVRGFEKRGVRNAAEVVVVSEQMAELVASEWGVPTDAQTVVPNGYFAETVSQYPWNPADDVRVAFLGTLHPKLDVEAIRSVAVLPEVDRVDVVGDGAERDTLAAARRDLGGDTLRLHGRLPDEAAYPILTAATVVINPQHQSLLQRASSPVKLFDYAGMGLPTVVAAGPDVAQTLHDHDAAVRVGPDESYAEAVRDLVTDADRRRTLSENAKRVAASWTWDDRVDQFARLYEGNGS